MAIVEPFIRYSRRFAALRQQPKLTCGTHSTGVSRIATAQLGATEKNMPFPKQTARTFTRTNIEAITPGQMGCYGLFINQGAWVYIGKGDIRKRLLEHLNGDNPCITRNGPTHYVDAVTNNMDETEKALILEFNPTCNKKVG